MSNRFNIYDEYREKFYRLPKVFFTNEKYINMSNDAKMAWAILRDRLDLSQKNKWIDENGDYYFKFSNKNLCKILNFSEPTLIKIKKELIAADLFEQVKQGLNKTNILYLNKPEVTEEDIYMIDKSENIEVESSHDKELKKFKSQNLKNLSSRTKKYLGQELKNFKSSDTESSDTELNELDDDDNNKGLTNKQRLNALINKNPHLEQLCKYLKDEIIDPSLINDISQEMIDQNVSNYRLEDARSQLKYMEDMSNNGQSFTAFARYFVNGLKYRMRFSQEIERKNQYEQQQAAERDTSVYYNWLE